MASPCLYKNISLTFSIICTNLGETLLSAFVLAARFHLAAAEIHAAPAASMIAAAIDEQPAAVGALAHPLKLIGSNEFGGRQGNWREDAGKIVAACPRPLKSMLT